jgi:hypothetical protein
MYSATWSRFCGVGKATVEACLMRVTLAVFAM